MKKLLIVGLLWSVVTVGFGQQTPQWLMPFYFTDANGDRDTVYVGFDPNASMDYTDSLYGETWEVIDTTKFNAYVHEYPNFAPSSSIYSDKVMKTGVTNEIMSLPLTIAFTYGKMPILMTWDDSLFNSSNLPFPDIAPRPRARADIATTISEPGYGSPLFGADAHLVSLTNYPYPKHIPKPVADSLIFPGSGLLSAQKSIGLLFLWIVPHDRNLLVNTKQKKQEVLKIYPNPSTGKFTIDSQGKAFDNYTVFSNQGFPVFKSTFNDSHNSIDLTNFPVGIYYLRIASSDDTTIHKLFKY